jgi:hypothetical protein
MQVMGLGTAGAAAPASLTWIMAGPSGVRNVAGTLESVRVVSIMMPARTMSVANLPQSVS